MSNSKVIGVVAFASVGAILFGIDCSNVGAAIVKPEFQHDFCETHDWTGHWPKDATDCYNQPSCSPENTKKYCADDQTQPDGYTAFVGFMASLLQLGACFGALVFGPPIARIGRRQCMSVGSLITIGGIVPQCFVQDYTAFLAARFVAGIGVGMITFSLPMFISEVAPASIRGSLGVTFQLVLTIGSLSAAIILQFQGITYQFAFVMPAIPAVVVLFGIFFLPASPRELLVKGLQPGLPSEQRDLYISRALNSLERLRGSPQEASDELQLIQENIVNEVMPAPWSKIFTDKSIRRRVVVANLLQWFQQFSGMNCLMNYGPEIYNGAGVPIDGLLANVFTSACNTAGTVVMMLLIDKWGRKTLFVMTTISMSIFMALAGVLSLGNTTLLGWLLLIAVCLTNIAFAIGWGGGAWVYPSEIFPMDVKEKALSTSVGSQWLGNFCINLLSSFLIKYLSYSGTFFFFAVCNVIGFAMVSVMVKETKGKSLEEVGVLFGAEKVLLPVAGPES